MRYLLLILLLSGCADTLMSNSPISSCSVEQLNTGVQINCTNGTSATINNGLSGQTGSIGPQGPIGNTGPQGVAGTSIITVQFCQNFTSTYPSSFPEYGLCINNQLYGVYWDVNLGAFLAYLPPGLYKSTNASEACVFSVVQGCEIQD